MPRETFTKELNALQDQMLELGTLVKQAILASVDALRRRDLVAAQQIVDGDAEINQRRFGIERDCLVLIATQQPLASDLRTIAAVLEIATELERMGDYAKGISRINLAMGDAPLLKPLIDIPRMAEKGTDMLTRALDAFMRRDVAAARAIPREDDEVDALYNQVYRELLTYIIADPHTIDQATQLLWVAHNLERFADRVTNICERVIFTVTGELTEMDAEHTGHHAIT